MDSLQDVLVEPGTRWLGGYVVAGAVALLAFRLRALTSSGLVAATLVGGTIVATAGWWPGVNLVGFFASASALSILLRRESGSSIDQARGARRDAVQVLANGGLPTLLAIASAIAGNPGPWLVAFAAAVAAAASDTWATEIGRLNATAPRLVTTWRPVPAGTSGAISRLGTVGALAGALLIGLLAAIGANRGWTSPADRPATVLAIATCAGFGGSMIDSLLGATLQAGYWCPTCHKPTERLIHTCGTPSTHRRGWRWLNNDAVNLVAIAGGAGAGLLAALAFA